MRFRQNGYDNWHLQLSHSFHGSRLHIFISFTDSVPGGFKQLGGLKELRHIALQIQILG